MHDLRISVTDRCNFRCTYCMPKEIFGRDYAFLPRDQVLSFEEIERIARAFVAGGVGKLRITGGEPLVRRDLPDLIAMLAALRTPDGGELDLTLTTNGSALRALARPLADAGLRRVTVSLDSLDDAVFGAMNGIDFPVARVLDGIDAAREAGLEPIKINMVVRRGINESSIVPMATWARESGLILRFIEYMDVGHSNGWRLDEVIPTDELLRDDRRDAGRSSRPIRRTSAKWPTAGDTSTAAASSASSPRSPSRSAATARGRGSRPRASSTRAFSRSRATTCGRCSEAARATPTWRTSSTASGPAGRTAIPRSGLRRPPRCRRSRCSRWAADRARPQAFHRSCRLVDSAERTGGDFVDNRVDPSSGPPVP